MAELELVRCGCGAVRNDEDQPAPVQVWNYYVSIAAGGMGPGEGPYEAPRLCRGCGVVYMLPKPSAPSSSNAR